jgi:hypothetical protein
MPLRNAELPEKVFSTNNDGDVSLTWPCPVTAELLRPVNKLNTTKETANQGLHFIIDPFR